MEHKKMSRWLTLAVGLLLMAVLFLPGAAFADLATAVTVEPPGQSVGTGATFTVGIYVVPDTAIAGMQFSLSFDPSLVTANGVTEGNLLSQGGASTFFMPGTINNVAGTITNVAGVITTPGGSVSQSGTFATISFTAKTAAGTSALDLSNVIVANPQAQAVPITVSDGSVTITTPPVPPMVPTTDKWGTVAMILLFSGLLVWMARRRQLVS
jgi:hypothetical protein